MARHYYLHIPFCHQRCPYCKFALTPIFDEAKKRRYLAYLKNEIKSYFLESGIPVADTIYFGGGTPSILSIGEIQEILSCFPVSGDTEISFESNPEDITKEYVEGIIHLGINRISIGVQSLNLQTLKAIHRSDYESILRALHSIGEALEKTEKNISVNIDFILGLPYSQSGEILKNIVELHTRFSYLTHTSVYMLENELYPKDWKSISLTESEIQKDFTEIIEYFEKEKWNHYELSNFAKSGYECRHNKGYWNHSDSLGFGLSSASYERGKRWNNSSSFTGYYQGKLENEEELTPEQIEIENMMFGLRTNGFSVKEDGLHIHREKLGLLVKEGFIRFDGEKISTTKTGIFILDHIMGELISPP